MKKEIIKKKTILKIIQSPF